MNNFIEINVISRGVAFCIDAALGGLWYLFLLPNGTLFLVQKEVEFSPKS